MTNQYTYPSPKHRFWTQVDIKGYNECWNWLGYKIETGYGRIGWDNTVKFAHRISYLIEYGPFDEKLYVLHKCDNPSCVNPTHLFLGTAKDNAADRENKGRGNHLKKHKFTPDIEQEIRNKYHTGEYSLGQLAKEYKVVPTTIRKIVKFY